LGEGGITCVFGGLSVTTRDICLEDCVRIKLDGGSEGQEDDTEHLKSHRNGKVKMSQRGLRHDTKDEDKE